MGQPSQPWSAHARLLPYLEQDALAKLIDWAHRLDHVAQSVDQRVKMPVWMELFEQRGGRLVLQDAGVARLRQ